MADERLRIWVGRAKRYNYELPGNQGSTRQHVELTADNARLLLKPLGGSATTIVAEADAYLEHPDTQFWAAYWFSRKHPELFIGLAEEAVGSLERKFPDGAPTVDGKIRDVATPLAERLLWKVAALAGLDINLEQKNREQAGVILLTEAEPKRTRRNGVFPLQRPLSWERMEKLAAGKPIIFARINTKVGEFTVEKDVNGAGEVLETNKFGFVSDLIETAPFATLLAQTANDEEVQVTREQAEEFLAAVTGLFAAEKG